MKTKLLLLGALSAALVGGAPDVLAQDKKKDEKIKTKVKEKKKGKKWYVTIDRFPKTVKEFKQVRDDLCKTPQGGLVCFIIAMKMWGEDEKLGYKCLPLVLDKSHLVETEDLLPKARLPGYKGWQVGRSITAKMKTSGFKVDKKYAALGYVVGTDPKKGYKLPAKGPYKFLVRVHRIQPKEKNQWRGFLNYTGASRPKPFYVRKNKKGVWKAYKTSSFFAGTIDPPKEEDDDL